MTISVIFLSVCKFVRNKLNSLLIYNQNKNFRSTLSKDSFGSILQNLNFICVIGIVESYLELWGKRVNFGITIAEIQQKVWERRRKRERKQMLNFGNVNTEIPLPNSCCLRKKCVWSAQSEKKKNLWQTNCGNAIVEIGKKNL